MSLLPLLPSGGIAYPGFSQLKNKALKVYDPILDNLLYEIVNDDFKDGFLINGERVYFAVEEFDSSYRDGQRITIASLERWEFPVLTVGSRVEFYADIEETYNASKQPSWVQNAKSIGQTLLFSGKITRSNQEADPSGGQAVTYECLSWMSFAAYVNVYSKIGNFELPERAYNIPVTAAGHSYKKSIKKSTVYIPSLSQYNYAPFGYIGIQAATGTDPDLGLPNNLTGNLELNVGEIIKDLFGSHREDLARERVVPPDWDGFAETGTLPYVQSELDFLTFIPDQIRLPERFLDAIKTLLRKSYPNYSMFVDRNRVWHFTAIMDNLLPSATDPNLIFATSAQEPTRLGVIRIKMAEAEGDGKIYGRLVRGAVSDTTQDRYTAVKIIGQEKVTTQEASTLKDTLRPAWGNGNAAQQINLEAGYVNGGLQSSFTRHYDRGDAGTGIPIYQYAEVGDHGFITFKGFQSELWPHTNDEWNGATMMFANGIQEVEGPNYSWIADSLKFTIVDGDNIADVGDGTPGYRLKVVHESKLDLLMSTEERDGTLDGPRIQISDDFGFPTTIGPNQLSVTYRMFEIVETNQTGGLINSNPTTPCDVRAIIPLGAQGANVPDIGIPGSAPGDLLEFGQRLGQTWMSGLGKLHSKAGGGSFYFGGKLIIPFAAIARARAKAKADAETKAFELGCAGEKSRVAQDIKVIYEKSSDQYFEVRVPASSPEFGDTFGGTAALIAGVKRELRLRASNFTSESLQAQYGELAKMVFRTVSDMEPAGEGWIWADAGRYLSLIDLHFRLHVEEFISAPVGATKELGIQEAVVTMLSINFRTNEATMSLSTEFNPLGEYSFENLREVMISARHLREMAEAQDKEKRLADCQKSILGDRPINALPMAAVCRDQVNRPTGPGKGKAGPPGDCHPTDGMVESSDGVGQAISTNAGYAGGYGPTRYDAIMNMAGGLAPLVYPLIDQLGRLFFRDRNGGIMRGDESQLTEGDSLHTGLIVDNTFAGWDTQPTRLTIEMGQLALQLLDTIAGISPETPAAVNYNVVSSYVASTGVITLVHDNMIVNQFQNGRIILSHDNNEHQYMLIASNTKSTVTLKDPAGAATFPKDADVSPNDHIYMVAQRKPLHDSTLPEGTRLFKDANSNWKAVKPDGTVVALTITRTTDFIPNAALDAGGSAPVFGGLLGGLLNAAGSDKSELKLGDFSLGFTEIIFKVHAKLSLTGIHLTNKLSTSSDGENAWTFTVRNRTQSLDILSVSYSTFTHGDFAVYEALNLGDLKNTALVAGDVITITGTLLGAPGDLSNLMATVEYDLT